MAIELTTQSKPYTPPITLEGIAVVWAGEWDDTKYYYKNQAVSHNGSSYRANKTTNLEPFIDSVDWEVIAVGIDPNTVPKTVDFTFADATSRTVYTTKANELITTVSVVVTEAFNGSLSLISIGDTVNPSRLGNSSSIYLEEVGEYETNPAYRYTAATNINLTLNIGSGATQGKGYIIIQSNY